MLRPLALTALALAACATTTSSGSGESTATVTGTPPPVAAAVQHEERQLTAEQGIQRALTDCDQVMSNEHLIPSEFLPAESSYNTHVQKAVLLDSTLRSSPTQWKAPSGKSDSYDAWLTRCDAWFRANHELFASASKVEEAARQGKPPSGGGDRLSSCQIEGGKLSTCGDAFSGDAPVLRDGHYLRCEVVGGQVNHCGEPFDGQAPLKQGDTWHDCDLAAGQIAACSDLGYDGLAPAQASAP